VHDDGAPAGGVREELPVGYVQGAAVSHVNGEGVEGTGLMDGAELLDGHGAP
jgi:hypothetical protein